MTGFNSKRFMAEDKMDYDTFYQYERTKLMGILKDQVERLSLVYNENLFKDYNNKQLKAAVADGYKVIEMAKENSKCVN
jgi:hypothetical protein